MGKILLTNQNVMDYVPKGSTELEITPDMILTPGAKDVCRIKQIKIVYGELTSNKIDQQNNQVLEKSNPIKENPTKNTSTDDSQNLSLDHRIKQMLRKEFNIVSEVEVWNITQKVLEELNKHDISREEDDI